jgi:thiol-disulfide isomerase/thioredoxin
MKAVFIAAAAVSLWVVTALAAQESIVGIGVSLYTDSETGAFKIAQVIPGGPAEKAGVKPGMLLRKVNGTELAGKKLTDCVALIRGPVGTKLDLELMDSTDNTTREFEIVRERIVVAAPAKARRGDPAAPLKIKEWVKGEPADPTDGKNVYVVEFWATWCGPCRVSIPHLTALQKRFKDKGVVVIGISDEGPATVKPFVKAMAGKMDYTVACDDGRATFAGYMEAYRHNGIPTAFVVDKRGKVVWDGHPMAGLDRAIEAVLAGAQPE